MATNLRKTDPFASVIRDTRNLLKKQIGAGASVHLDAAETDRQISSANAADLATSLVLANELKAKYTLHIGADNFGAGMAHLLQDATNTIAAAAAVDLATAQTLANELKADYNAHRSQAGVHSNNDAGNAITSADATDLASLQTLLNELKTDFNAHMAAAPANCAPSIRLVEA
jgi:glutamyl-tRNA reductase